MTVMMRAVSAERAGAPEVLRLIEVPVPQPAPGEVRLRVAYCGMNPIDAFIRSGTLPWPGIRWPMILGIEHSGRIDAVGDGIDAKLLGKRVLSRTGFGGYAEYSLADAEEVLHIPDHLDWETATAYRGCTHTAWHCVHTVARVSTGDRILIHSAAGPVGIMATQIAKEAGARVIGLVGGAKKVQYARKFGADHIIDYTRPSWVSDVERLTGGVDCIIDGNQGPQAESNYQLVRPLGQIVYIGMSANAPAPPIDVGMLIAKSIRVSGFNLRAVEAAAGDDAASAITAAIASGRWKVPIGDVVPLEETADLHRRLANRELMGRALIRVGGEI